MARQGTTRQSTFDLLAKAVGLIVYVTSQFTTDIFLQKVSVWGCLIGLITGRFMGEGLLKLQDFTSL